MAIVHISTKAISRKSGQSAVASAAYRAGVILKDERYDKSHDYSKKSGVMSADIILPSALKAKGLIVSREEVWNKAEHVEGRKDSRVAREWLINLPHELDEAKRKALAHEFTQALADKYNIIADCAIHSPSKKEIARGADPRNYHAHILVTTREAQLDADGKLFFDKQLKIPFEWSNKKRDAKGLQSSIKEIKDVRQLWVDMANKALAEHDVTPLDARSFKAQGLDRLPTVKMGVDATNMERKGINTENGNKNRAVYVINQRREFTKQSKRRAADEQHTVEYIEWSTDRVEWANNRHQQIVKRTNDNQQRVEQSQQGIEWATRKNESAPRRKRRAGYATRRVMQRVDDSKSDIKRVAGTNGELDRRITGHKWRSDLTKRLIVGEESSIKYCNEQSNRTANRVDDTKRWTESTKSGVEHSERWISANSRGSANSESIASSIHQNITERAKPAPSPFNDTARRARATRLAEQERRDAEQQRRQDSDARRNRYEDERTVDATRHLKLNMAIVLLSRHHENKALQHWETVADYPDKLDERQIQRLDDFSQTIGADGKITDFLNDSRRIAELFTGEVIEQHRDIIQMLRSPAVEREQYNILSPKTHTDALQTPLNISTKPNSNDRANSQQRASQEDLLDTSKQTQSNTRKFRR